MRGREREGVGVGGWGEEGHEEVGKSSGKWTDSEVKN